MLVAGRLFRVAATLLAIGASVVVAFGDCSAYESVQLPAEAGRVAVSTTAPSCDSYRSYRGIGRPVDYAAARSCAWQERTAETGDLGRHMVGGSIILADIYYNGAGVKRNIPLAMRLGCEAEGFAVPDAISRPASGQVEFCDYAATTITATVCSGYTSEVEDNRRRLYFDSLKPSMTAEQRVAFEKLLSAEGAFVTAHAAEVYQAGTIHGIRTLKSQAILKDLFRTEVTHFEHGKWPSLSQQEIGLAESGLNREYEEKLQQLRTRPEADFEQGMVTAEHLASVEGAWKIYRDAWVAFARLRYPASVDAIRAEITLDRYRLLKTIQ